MDHGNHPAAAHSHPGREARRIPKPGRSRPRRRPELDKRLTPAKFFRGYLLPFAVTILAIVGVVDLADRAARWGFSDDPLLQKARTQYLASVEEELGAKLAPESVGEDPIQRRLPERLQSRLDFVLEHGNDRQIALAKIAQREDWDLVSYAIRQSRDEAVAEAVRLFILEGHGLYAAGDFQAAAEVYERALIFQPGDPDLLRNAALATIHIQEGDPAAHAQKARAILQQAIAATPEKSPRQCALLNQLGLAWIEGRAGAAAENVREAIATLNAALKIRACAEAPEIRAKLLDSVGLASLKMPEGNPIENLQIALSAFQSAGDLALYSRNKRPADWAIIQIHLGNTWRALADHQSSHRHSHQIEAYKALRKSLSYLNPEQHPLEWAAAQNSLGLLFDGLSTDGRQNYWKSAIASFRNAEKIHRQTGHPADWARTRLNAANTLRHVAETGGKNCSAVWQAMAYLKSVFAKPLPAPLRAPLEPEVEAGRQALFGAWSTQKCGDLATLADVPAAN